MQRRVYPRVGPVPEQDLSGPSGPTKPMLPARETVPVRVEYVRAGGCLAKGGERRNRTRKTIRSEAVMDIIHTSDSVFIRPPKAIWLCLLTTK